MSKFFFNEDLDENSFLRVGDKAPDFTLETDKGKNWRLSEHIGKVVALLFYPQNETFVCTKQLCSLRNRWKDYVETRAEIVGISPGTIKNHREFGKKYELPLPLLVDEGRKITNIYGFHWILPTFLMRTVVIIDAKGMIRTRRVMLRAFRPTDRSVISAIYAARADALQDQYRSITKKTK